MPVVPAVLVDSIFGDPLPPAGSFKFWSDRATGQIGGMNFRCPCGCGQLFGVRFAPPAENGWTRTGADDALTIRPSIMCLNADGSAHYHGFLTEGLFVPC
jgi:hypothetical protein